MKLLFLLFLVVASVASAYAEDADTAQSARDTYYSSGYIVGINLGQVETDAADIAGYSKENKGFFARPFVGFNVSPYFAVQFGYLIFPKVKFSQAGASDITLKNSGFDGLFTGRFPLGEGFALYGNVGAAIVKAKQTQSGNADLTQNATVLAYGGGLDYSFANIGGLHSVLDYYHLDKKDTSTLDVPAQNTFSIGIYYQF